MERDLVTEVRSCMVDQFSYGRMYVGDESVPEISYQTSSCMGDECGRRVWATGYWGPNLYGSVAHTNLYGRRICMSDGVLESKICMGAPVAHTNLYERRRFRVLES